MSRCLKYIYLLSLCLILLFNYSSPFISASIDNINDHHHLRHNNNNNYDKGIIVIPGLGRVDRLTIVVANLKLIYSQNEMHTTHRLPSSTMVGSNSNNSFSNFSRSSDTDYQWDCIIYIYASRESNSVFWNQVNDLQFLYTVCQVVEVPNKRVAENLHMLQPALIRNYYSRVFLLLDDCILTSSFNMSRLLLIMSRNQLTVISPAVRLISYITLYM